MKYLIIALMAITSNLMAKPNMNEKELMELIIKDDKINKSLLKKKIDKTFYVKNRLVNILVKWKKF